MHIRRIGTASYPYRRNFATRVGHIKHLVSTLCNYFPSALLALFMFRQYASTPRNNGIEVFCTYVGVNVANRYRNDPIPTEYAVHLQQFLDSYHHLGREVTFDLTAWLRAYVTTDDAINRLAFNSAFDSFGYYYRLAQYIDSGEFM